MGMWKCLLNVYLQVGSSSSLRLLSGFTGYFPCNSWRSASVARKSHADSSSLLSAQCFCGSLAFSARPTPLAGEKLENSPRKILRKWQFSKFEKNLQKHSKTFKNVEHSFGEMVFSILQTP